MELECNDVVYSSKKKISQATVCTVYYSNSVAKFHLLLEGDLAFRLNPGPLLCSSSPSCASSNPTHPKSQQLSLCTLNARSVKIKSADLMDYMCDKFDIIAITETWL